MRDDFEIDCLALGPNQVDYPGAFTAMVNQIILDIIMNSKSVLHLFSGTSKIGNERIDIQRHEATRKMDVADFILNDDRNWEYCVLDPPYDIIPQNQVAVYHIKKSIANDKNLRKNLPAYFRKHVRNIIWLDQCAPILYGFKRIKLWLLLPGLFRSVRVLSFLTKDEQLPLKFNA